MGCLRPRGMTGDACWAHHPAPSATSSPTFFLQHELGEVAKKQVKKPTSNQWSTMGLDKAIMKVGGALGVIGGIQCVASPLLSPPRAPRVPGPCRSAAFRR